MPANPETDKPKMASLLAFFSVTFAIGGIGFGFYLLWINQTANASLSFTVGILLSLFSQFERFESVKGFGIEAKINKLDIKIREADRINETLKKLTASVAQLAFEMMARTGRLSGPIGREESLEIEESLLRQMREVQIAETEIDRAILPLRRVSAFEILLPAIHELNQTLGVWRSDSYDIFEKFPVPHDVLSPEYTNALAERKKVDILTEKMDNISKIGHGIQRSEELRHIVKELVAHPQKNFVPSQKLLEAIEDHDHYITTGEHRNVHRWIAATA